MPTCGGIGTYLPNYHTMQVSGQGENDRKNDILFYTIFRYSVNSDIVHESNNKLDGVYPTGV